MYCGFENHVVLKEKKAPEKTVPEDSFIATFIM